jgi:hypothetical protein
MSQLNVRKDEHCEVSNQLQPGTKSTRVKHGHEQTTRQGCSPRSKLRSRMRFSAVTWVVRMPEDEVSVYFGWPW